MADRDHDSSSLEPGVGKSAAVIGGVGLASAGAAVAAGVQVQNIIEAAREAAIQALTEHQHSLAEGTGLPGSVELPTNRPPGLKRLQRSWMPGWRLP